MSKQCDLARAEPIAMSKASPLNLLRFLTDFLRIGVKESEDTIYRAYEYV
jgi:hypothetical protein